MDLQYRSNGDRKSISSLKRSSTNAFLLGVGNVDEPLHISVDDILTDGDAYPKDPQGLVKVGSLKELIEKLQGSQVRGQLDTWITYKVISRDSGYFVKFKITSYFNSEPIVGPSSTVTLRDITTEAEVDITGAINTEYKLDANKNYTLSVATSYVDDKGNKYCARDRVFIPKDTKTTSEPTHFELISSGDVNLKSSETSGTVTITSQPQVSFKLKSALSQESWLKVEAQSNKLNLSCDKNTGAKRTTIVTVVAEYNGSISSVRVNVTQEGATEGPEMYISGDTLYLAQDIEVETTMYAKSYFEGSQSVPSDKRVISTTGIELLKVTGVSGESPMIYLSKVKNIVTTGKVYAKAFMEDSSSASGSSSGGRFEVSGNRLYISKSFKIDGSITATAFYEQ